MKRMKNEIVLELLEQRFSVCKLKDFHNVDISRLYCFTARTDQEYSLVCPTEDIPADTTAREDDWRCFRVCGPLAFSLTGILAGIADVLAENDISIFAVSTFNTDYVLTKEEQIEFALHVLAAEGYAIRKPADTCAL